jgi:hypothetical protein
MQFCDYVYGKKQVKYTIEKDKYSHYTELLLPPVNKLEWEQML